MAILTKLEVQKNNKNRVNIFIDGEFFLGCYIDLVYRLGLNQGMDIDAEKIKEIIAEQEYEDCKQTAFNSITRAEKSEKNMRKKLSEKYGQDAVDRVIDLLKEYSFIDDERFARRIVINDQNFKRNGINKIKQNLYVKGIDRREIEESLSLIDEEKELENAIYLAEKKLNKIKSTDKKIIKNKLYQHLLYKGFNYSTINTAISKVLTEVDEW